jgi:hypothetical protein
VTGYERESPGSLDRLVTLRRLPLLLALLALALFAAGCGADESGEEGEAAAAPPPPPPMETYRNDEEGFSIDLPDEWTYVEPGGEPQGESQDLRAPEGSLVYAASPEAADAPADEISGETLTIARTAMPANFELESWTKENERAIETTFPDVEDLYSRIVALPPGEAAEFTFKVPSDEARGIVGVRNYVVPREDELFVLTFQTTAEELDGKTEEFERIADTFKLD